MLFAVEALYLVLLAAFVRALQPLAVKGTKLYDADGKQFFIKGLAYTLGDKSLDPLLDSKRCEVDAGLMKQLGANTIRVYTVDSSQNHDACMQIFDSAGIYVWLDLPNIDHTIMQKAPTWTMDIYKNWSATIDAFGGYENVLTFSVGSVIISDANFNNASLAAPFIKAAARDMKAFRDARGYRSIPISYSGGSLDIFRLRVANYLACGKADDAIDMYGLTIFDWCYDSDTYKAGYNKLYEEFQNLDIPVLVSETGCSISNMDRSFDGVSTVLGPVFNPVFSGAIIWEWANYSNDAGIVQYDDDKYKSFPTTLSEYNQVMTVFSEASPTGTDMTAYTPSNSAPNCPTTDSTSSWLVKPDVALPTIEGLNMDTVTARTTITGTGPETTGEGKATPTPTSSDGSAGLSTSAVIGISIGCILGGLAILGTAGLLYYRRRRRVHKRSDAGLKATLGASDKQPPGFKPELPAFSIGPTIHRHEMDAQADTSKRSQPPLSDPQEIDGSEVFEVGVQPPTPRTNQVPSPNRQ